MGLGVGDLIWAFLLFTNAIAILNEERFLSRIGWSTTLPPTAAPSVYDSYADPTGGGVGGAGAGNQGLKSRLVNLIAAVRTLMRIPLMVVNLAIIMYELALG